MKKLSYIFAALVLAISASGQPSIGPASVAEVQAGTVRNKFVSPATLKAGGGFATYYKDTNALAFCDSVGITDLATRNDVIGFVNELRQAGLWSNLVDAVFFYPRFMPTNGGATGKTLFGRTIYFTNATFYKWGLSLTNGTTSAWIYGLPDCSTNSQVYSYHIPLGAMDGNGPGGYLAGVANIAAGQSVYVTANRGANVTFRVRNDNTENGTSANNQQPSWCLIPQYQGYGYNYGNEAYFAANKCVSGFLYDGRVQGFFDFYRVQIGFTASQYVTNLAASGLSITAPLTNWLIGKDFKTTNVTGTAKSDIMGGLVFNKVLSDAEYRAAYRALRWIDPDDKTTALLGDSMTQISSAAASQTNAPVLWWKLGLENYRDEINNLDFAYAGDSITAWVNPAITALSTNFLQRLDESFHPSGKVKTKQVICLLGLNDCYSGYGAAITTNTLTLLNYAKTNGWQVSWGTIGETSTNGSVYPQTGTGEGYRTSYNNWLYTNAYLFSRIIPIDLLKNQTLANTNNNYTLDGTHYWGTNGWILNRRVVALMTGKYDVPLLKQWSVNTYVAESPTNNIQIFAHVTNGIVTWSTTP